MKKYNLRRMLSQSASAAHSVGRTCIGFLFLAFFLSIFACSPITKNWLRPDYAKVDMMKTKRLWLIVAPLPGDNPKVAKMWALMARRYANQHRNFLIKGFQTGAKVPDMKSICKEGIEGWMHLVPTAKKEGSKVAVSIKAKILRCRDQEPVWKTEAIGTWASNDPNLKTLQKHYSEEIGPEVSAYVAPSFHLIRAVMDTLPQPKLSDADVMEKIQMGE